MSTELEQNLLKRYIDGFTFIGSEQEVSSLLEDIGHGLMLAPANSNSSYGFAYKGGLLNKILQVNDMALKINKSLPKEHQVETNTLIKTVLLSFVGAHNMFIEEESEWSNKKGIFYKFNPEYSNVPMSVGDKSVQLCYSYNINLTSEQHVAIVNLFKPETDTQIEVFNTVLGDILKTSLKLITNINNKDAREATS